MRALGLWCLISAGVFAAQDVELRLPPSDAWVEELDPQPPTSATTSSRFFVLKGDAEVTLRAVRDSSLRLDYSEEVLKQLGARVTAGQQKPGAMPVKVSEPHLYTAEGVSIGSLQVLDLNRMSTLFYIPSENGDWVLNVSFPRGHEFSLAELIATVESAKHLRRPDSFGAGTPVMAVMAAISLATIGTLLYVMRRRPTSAP